MIVAIDGPAGVGKGTITKLVAKDMNLVNIDTGATYRCVALSMINKGIKLEETEKIIENTKKIKIDIKNENGVQTIYLDGENVTDKIRTSEVNKIVSPVSSIVEVRKIMVDLQRKLAEGKDVIMEGRDIGTVVFPNADVKIYLDATEDERARRRYKENLEKGITDMTFEEVKENMHKRDENDKNKEVGALKIDLEAKYIDTTNLSINEVKREVEKAIRSKKKYLKLEPKIYWEMPDGKGKTFRRKVSKAVLGTLYKIVFRPKFVNIEKDYANFEGPLILCANHVGTMDAVGLTLVPKRRIRFIGKSTLMRFGAIRWLGHVFDVIPINRGQQDLKAMKRCLQALKNNETLGIFPEGTRKGLEKGVKPKDGAAFLAIKTGATIIPVGIQGKFRPFTKNIFNFGEPISFKEIQQRNPPKDLLEEKAREVFEQIIMLTNEKV